MRLSSRQLTAFMAVAATLNFTRAAGRLNITQSALSHRIRGLETELGVTLMNRSSRGVQLTEAGNRLLRYCRVSASLEEEILADFAPDPDGRLRGTVRIASHSSILRPVLIPALAATLRDNPLVQCELILAEFKDLPGLLQRNEADFVIMDRRLEQTGLETHTLGREVYIAVEGRAGTARQDIYLDLDPEDHVTAEFFRQQDSNPDYQRSFMGDVFGIIAGVEHGLGRAVVSRHLIRDNPAIQTLPQYRPVSTPVTLHFHNQHHYTRLHREIREVLCRECPAYLD